MFGIVPRPLWERRIAPDERNRIPLAMRCLLLRGHGRVILVDTGLGHKSDAKFRDIYGVDHEHSTLEGSLAALGVTPDDVTDVAPDAPALRPRRRRDPAHGRAGALALTFPQAHAPRPARALGVGAREPARGRLVPGRKPRPAGGLRSAGATRRRRRPVPRRRRSHVVDGHTRGQQLVRVHGRRALDPPRRRPGPDGGPRAAALGHGLRRRAAGDGRRERASARAGRQAKGGRWCSSTTPRSPRPEWSRPSADSPPVTRAPDSPTFRRPPGCRYSVRPPHDPRGVTLTPPCFRRRRLFAPPSSACVSPRQPPWLGPRCTSPPPTALLSAGS